MASLLFLSLVLSNFLNKNSWFFIIYLLLPVVLFFAETINYPNFLQDFFLNYSDKFDFLKVDLALIIMSALIISIIKFKNQYHIFIYFIVVNALYLPFLYIKVRCVSGATVFFLYIFLKNISYSFKDLKTFQPFNRGCYIYDIN